jgi:formate dehydrogenase major subunit
MGSNMAECHPVGFQWVMEAKARGARVIHIDPRFTRTSAVADLHVPLRAGSDIAFLGGIVNYILTHERYFREYVVAYTNAPSILRDDFKDTEDLDGLFSDVETWSYENVQQEHTHADESHEGHGRQVGSHMDPTLEHPRCVFQVLKRHFSRYTPAMVAETCGVSEAQFLEVCEALCANSGRDRTSAFCYAVGWTQHTTGAQIIRCASIVQLLLGNIGRPGGGVMALRGHATIQGSTDVPTLYNLLPGYLPMPLVDGSATWAEYIENHTSPGGWWTQFPTYAVSLLKAWWGESASADNDWCYEYVPKMTGDHSHMPTVTAMADGKVRGYFVMGENPVVGSMHGSLQRAGLAQLDWLVVRDFYLIETAEFWRDDPSCNTEVFFFPAASHTEKDGTFTNTQRLLQFHHKALEPSGDCRSELWFMYHLGLRLRALYVTSTLERDRPLLELTWSYPTVGPHDEPDVNAILKEINGYVIDGSGSGSGTGSGAAVGGFTELKDDGTTACGCWIYAGCFANGVNQTARRTPGQEQSWVAPEWGWAWPANRRLMYNRASADPEGRPWSERKAYVWWDDLAQKWTGHDVPDFIVDRPPSFRPPPGASGTDTISGATPFIMQSDGRGWLFAPTGLSDGPLPTHWEPHEGVIANPLYGQQGNPETILFRRPDNPYHGPYDDAAYPYAVTTYRLTEQHTAGGMSRWLPWLSELQPEFFCEVSPELARERGLENGGWATIWTARTSVEARVLVTSRIPPLRVGRGGRRIVHQIGLPYHWGSAGLVRGDSANELIAFVSDPNVSIQESKALTANIRPGRRPR